jgi:hypothetical protein
LDGWPGRDAGFSFAPEDDCLPVQLLARGASIEALNEWSRSPLQVALMAGERKAAIFSRDMGGTTLLLRRDLLDLIK